MRLLALGCLHGKVHASIYRAAKNCDAILCAGDLTDTDSLRKMEFDTWAGRKEYPAGQWETAYKKAVKSSAVAAKFLSSAGVPVFLVAGNSDFFRKDVGKHGIENIFGGNVKIMKSRVLRFGGIYIAGFSYYRGYTEKRIVTETSFSNKFNALFSKIRRPKNTLLIMHDVPFGVFDIVKRKDSPAHGEHVGDPLINKNLKKKRLLGHVCAHMHEYQGLKYLHGTPIINTGYGRIGRHAVIETGNALDVEFF